MQAQSLGWEAPLEEGMVTHSSVLAWRIPWTEEPGGLESMGLQKRQTRLSDELKPYVMFSKQPRGEKLSQGFL